MPDEFAKQNTTSDSIKALCDSALSSLTRKPSSFASSSFQKIVQKVDPVKAMRSNNLIGFELSVRVRKLTRNPQDAITFLTDLTDEGVSIPADATDPIIGLNLVKPAGENVYLASLVIQILDNSFALSSLKDLSTDATTSGIAVYKDDGDGIFGETVDTPDPLAATPALISSPAEDFLRIQLVLETPQDIPENDTGDDEGDDYFVIIRTSSESSVEGDIFAMWGSKVQEIRSRALGFVSDSTPVDGIVDAIPFSDTINADDTTWNNDGSGGDYNNWTMVFTSGLLEGNAYYITEVTADTITCDGANFNDVVATDEFTIYKIDSRTYERLEPTVVTYTLSVSSDPDSCEPADGDHYYLPGSSVTCSVTSPTAGVGGTRYVCTGYTLDETTVSDTSVDITMNADHTLAWIWKTQYQLTTAVSPTGGGTVTPDIESADGWYDEDTVVTLTAAPGIDYVFSSWSGDLTGDGSPAILTMDAAKAVTANFIQDGHTLEVTSAYDTPDPGVGVHGYADGTPVTCTLGESTVDGTPGTQYVYTGWNGTGSFVSPATGTDTEVIRTIHEDSTIIWNWKTQHELTASVAAGAGTMGLNSFVYTEPTNTVNMARTAGQGVATGGRSSIRPQAAGTIPPGGRVSLEAETTEADEDGFIVGV